MSSKTNTNEIENWIGRSRNAPQLGERHAWINR